MNPKELKTKYLSYDYKLKGEFQGDNYKREETLTRAERYAGYTLPNIFPDDPLMEYDEMQNDFTSFGAQATINLTNKIMMALFQPSNPFFRAELTPEQMAQVLDAMPQLKEAQVKERLASAERDAMRKGENLNARVVMTNIISQLIITGNSLLFMPEGENLQNYSLRDYTIERDLRGNMKKLIIRETKAVTSLEDDLRALALSEGYEDTAEISLYTCVLKVKKNKYIVWQEMEDLCYCHKKLGVYNAKTLPYIPLVWDLCRNKDYGTGLVENYAGDFHMLSTLAEASLDYTTIITDVKVLVDPAGSADVRELTESPSGAYVNGREEDLHVHTASVQEASQFIENRIQAIERRLAAAFLLNSQVTRDAERVTAQEIRLQALELEGSLGGVYSRLANELQKPYAIRLLALQGAIFSDIEPVIVTGLDSLSRSSELDRTRMFLQDLALLTELPESLQQKVDYEGIVAVLGAGHGVKYQTFLKSTSEQEKDKKADANAEANAEGQKARAVAAATQ